MAHFVLIHGAWYGAWAWQAVGASLVMHGHQVDTLDLPGSGADCTPMEDVTLAACAERIAAAVVGAGNPVTLVGHDFGGMACAAASELVPRYLARLVYLCAFAPHDGDTMRDLAALVPGHPAPPAQGTGACLASAIPREFRVAAFMHDAPPAVAAWAAAQFRQQALAPMRSAVTLTQERSGKVPASYVACTEDRLVAPSLQHLIAQRAGCDRIVELPLSHSPFLSAPWILAETLHRLATAN